MLIGFFKTSSIYLSR